MKLIESIIAQKRTFCFCDDTCKSHKAEIVFVLHNDDNEWSFVKCDYYHISQPYSLQDWEFIGLVANKIKELNNGLNK